MKQKLGSLEVGKLGYFLQDETVLDITMSNQRKWLQAVETEELKERRIQESEAFMSLKNGNWRVRKQWRAKETNPTQECKEN